MTRRMYNGVWEDESGSTTFNYGAIAALLSLVVVAAVSANGNSLSSLVEQAIAEFDQAFTG